MADKEAQQAIRIARGYGQLSRALAEQANAERIRIAQGNFDASRRQIEAQGAERASELSRVFQRHTATVTANAAYRGVGGGSVAALVGSATAEAEIARRNIEINVNNAVGAEAAQASVPIEDPVLAELEGTFRGLQIGSEFVESLARLEPEQSQSTQWVKTGAGWQQVIRTRERPGEFSLLESFPELDQFLREG